MITVNSETGKIVMKGSTPVFIAEYIIMSQLILKHIKDELPEDKINGLLTEISKAIAEEESELTEGIMPDLKSIMEALNE